MLPSFTIVELFVFLTHCSYSLWSNVSFANIIPVSWLFFQLLILFLVVSICNRFTSIAFVVYVLGMLSEVFVYTSGSSMFSHKVLHLVLWSILILVLCLQSTFIFGIWVSSFPRTVYGESVIPLIYVLGVFVKHHLTVSTRGYFWVLCPVDMCVSSFGKSYVYESVSLVI